MRIVPILPMLSPVGPKGSLGHSGISHGCIRCYPEHIRLLYPQVKLGTKVEIVYEPIKFGKKDGQIFVEVHPDVYGRLPDFDQYAAEKLKSCKLADYVDPEKYKLAVRLKNGMPTNITLSLKDWKQDVSGKTLVVGDQGSGISTKR